MDLGLAGKTAYVTGAATGIGRATVEALAAEGAAVYAVDIQGQTLSAYVDELESGEVAVGEFDLSTEAGVDAAADAMLGHFGSAPDILVNNVGAGKMLGFEEIDDALWHRTLELNLFAMVRTCRVVVPRMAERGGAVVNVASDLARQAEPVIVDYAASKSAMLSVSKSLALTYAPSVRVNSVCPGPIWTPFWYAPGGFAETMEKTYGAEGQEAIDAFIADRGIPLGRMGLPEEVARTIVFLASPAASYTTGSVYGVDGGTIRATA
ncbi:SDR family NAD(P)-dependent oxidoreductase [Herbiconiux sp. A18JL235]|uniref:SDR family NAD(P)-dependent oxidoreductase n=1 Tax=Herbiconiux sp. A18JL235 TaxID=3152363 RepID=A0AB39BJ63_9MICO